MSAFGPWRADLPPVQHDGLTQARNVYRTSLGYKPIKQLSAVTEDALGYDWLGGGAFAGVGGSTALLSGTTDGLYSYASGAWTKEYPAGAGSYSLPFFFAQFGDDVIGVSGSTAPIAYDISAGTAALLGGSPPSASYIAIAGDHVFLAGNSSAVTTLYSSALNDAADWSTVADGAQSQVLPDGGRITGLSGGEYALVFQESAIRIVEMTDAPVFWTVRKVADGVGALTQGGICQAGRKVAFYSRDGFKLWNEGEIVPIGVDKVDLTFAAAYSEAQIKDNLRSVYDEKRRLIVFSMPGRLWIFHLDTGDWTDCLATNVIGISTGKTVSVTIEDMGATYGAIEDVPGSLDDPIWQGGQPMLLLAKSDGYLYTFGSSANMAATLENTRQEIAPGAWATVRNARVDTDAISGLTVALDCFTRLGDSATTKSTSTMRDNGDMPILATGHYFQSRVTTAAGATWSYILGLNLDATPGGTR